jgi:hypothetical protein
MNVLERSEDSDIANAVIDVLYDFLTEPSSSIYAASWASLLSWLSAAQLLVLVAKSCDGPNHYTGRPNKALYTWLPDSNQYERIEDSISIPLMLDSLIRLFFLIAIFVEKFPVQEKFLKDIYNMILIPIEIISIMAFLIHSTYLRPRNIFLDRTKLSILLVAQLLCISRIIRRTQNRPSIWAIRLALYRSMEEVFLPVFLFLLLNTTAGVLFYFIEPCFDITECPWFDIYFASCYSVVSMTSGIVLIPRFS